MTKATPYSTQALLRAGAQRTFSGDDLLQIALPMGGLGAGCISLNGCGGLQDFCIRNRPEVTASPDGHGNSDAAFAVLHVKGDKRRAPVTRLVEGPLPVEKIYNLGLKGQGHREGGHEGLPRFARCSFKGEYPFGEVSLSDPKVPLRVTLTGWSPFIPLDDTHSGMPVVMLEYTLKNTGRSNADFELSYHLSHPVHSSSHEDTTRTSAIAGAGVEFTSTEASTSRAYGSAALVAVGHTPRIKAMWFRGGWFDGISALWRELETGTFTANKGWDGVDVGGRNGGSILLSGSLKPGASVTYPIIIAWHFPNCYTEAGVPRDAGDCGCGPEGCDTTPTPKWRPFYAGQWQDAKEVALYARKHYAALRARTQAFRDALFSSSLPPYVLDAVSANLSILKSPTVLRQENGNVWGWEGCFPEHGCCHGTCTHVWNYAQSMPHLFPQLERTLRELEYERSIDERGHVNFRSALPDGPTDHGFHAAADGQLGGIMKLYRDWQIGGDNAWMARLYPAAKRSLDYCIETWDPKRQGALFEPHHNTYDIEFWGADGMCTSIYIGALSALAIMARHLGHDDDARAYDDLARRGADYMDRELFNGEYYAHKVQYKGLRDTSFAEMVAKVNAKSGSVARLLKKEGPKYQYGSGCLSDGVIGAWMARMYGIQTPMNAKNLRRTLKAIFQYNFRKSLAEHANPQRPGYALGNEAGLLLCSWPKGGKPTLPFVYSDEVWTGIEYQVASHLIAEGRLREGLSIVKAVRDRHDGRVRNPWNEYECGNHYARAMAGYALLGALSGFDYSAVRKTLTLAPKLDRSPFTTFFCTATGFGTLTLTRDRVTIDLVEGTLAIDRIEIERRGETVRVEPALRVKAGKPGVARLRKG